MLESMTYNPRQLGLKVLMLKCSVDGARLVSCVGENCLKVRIHRQLPWCTKLVWLLREELLTNHYQWNRSLALDQLILPKLCNRSCPASLNKRLKAIMSCQPQVLLPDYVPNTRPNLPFWFDQNPNCVQATAILYDCIHFCMRTSSN